MVAMNNIETNKQLKSDNNIRDFYRFLTIGLLITILIQQYGTPSGAYIIVGLGISRIIQILIIIFSHPSKEDYE